MLRDLCLCFPDVASALSSAEVAKPLRLRTEAGPIIANPILEDCTPEVGYVGFNAYMMDSSFVAFVKMVVLHDSRLWFALDKRHKALLLCSVGGVATFER